MSNYESTLPKSEFHLIKQNSKATQVLTEALESNLTQTMDSVLQSIFEKLFLNEDALDQFSDLIFEKNNISDEVLDQWLTLRDILLIHKHLGKNLTLESYTLIRLAARWIVNWPVDREKLFLSISRLQEKLGPFEQRLIKDLIKEYTQARNKLVNANLRLVAHLANRYRDKGLDTEELIQEGTIGVIQAANRFNASLGNRFTTYAYWWIQQSLKQALSDKRGAVRLPTNVTDRISSIDRFKQAFIRTYGHTPDLTELQSFSGLDRSLLEQFQKIGNLGISLNAPSFDDNQEEKIDTIINETNPVVNRIYHWGNQKLTDSLINMLSERQQTVVRLYHGIGVRQEFTFKEIAPILGITLERTRQIYYESLHKLKNNLMS